MSDLRVLVWIVVFALGGSALAQSPLERDQGSGTVASNAGVSLDSDSPSAERGDAIGAVPTASSSIVPWNCIRPFSMM